MNDCIIRREVFQTARINIKKIDSPANPVLKAAAEVLARRSKYGADAFIIEGPHLVEAALSAGAKLKKVFVTPEFVAKAANRGLLKGASGAGAAIFELSARAMKKITDAKSPQGVSALCSYKPMELDWLKFKGAPLIVVSDGISEPGNLGAIIRSADAFGADAVVMLPGTCDPFGPRTLRATSGSAFNVPMVFVKAVELIPWLRGRGISTAAATPRARQTIAGVDLTKPVAFIFGNESRGISGDIIKATDIRFRIPIPGRAESLNVAASAAVCLYEAVRQRK